MATHCNEKELKAIIYDYLMVQEQYKNIEDYISMLNLTIDNDEMIMVLYIDLINKLNGI